MSTPNPHARAGLKASTSEKRLVFNNCKVLQREGVSLPALRTGSRKSMDDLLSSPKNQKRFRNVILWMLRTANKLHPEEYVAAVSATLEKSPLTFICAYEIECSSLNSPVREHIVTYPLSLGTAASNFLERYQRVVDDILTKDKSDPNWSLSAFVLRGFLPTLYHYYDRYCRWWRPHKDRLVCHLNATSKAFDDTIRAYPATQATTDLLEAIAVHRGKLAALINPGAATRFDRTIADAVKHVSNPFVYSETHERFANLKELLTRSSNHPKKPSEPHFTQLQVLHQLALDPSWRPPTKHCDPSKPDSYTRYKDHERIFAELRWNNIRRMLSENPPCYRRVLFELCVLSDELKKVTSVHKDSARLTRRVNEVLDVQLIRQWSEAGSENGLEIWDEWVELVFNVMEILLDLSERDLQDADTSGPANDSTASQEPTASQEAAGSSTGSSSQTARVMRTGMSAKEARNITSQPMADADESSDRAAAASKKMQARVAEERARMAATPFADRPRELTHALEMLFAYTRHVTAMERQRHLAKLARAIYTEGQDITPYLFNKFAVTNDADLCNTKELMYRAFSSSVDWAQDNVDVFTWGMVLTVSPAALLLPGDPCADECTYPETLVFDVDRLDALRLEFAHLSMCSAMLAQVSAMLMSPFVQNRKEAWTSLSAYIVGTDAAEAAPDQVATGIMNEFARVVTLTGPSPFNYTALLRTGDRTRNGADPVHRLAWVRMRKIWFTLVKNPASTPAEIIPGIILLLPRIQKGAIELRTITRVNAQLHGYHHTRFINEARNGAAPPEWKRMRPI